MGYEWGERGKIKSEYVLIIKGAKHASQRKHIQTI
jgi:hypothetical protein